MKSLPWIKKFTGGKVSTRRFDDKKNESKIIERKEKEGIW